MKQIISLLTVLLLFSISNSFSQSTYEFLRVDMSARAAALGGSFVSNNDDVDVIFYNPAGTQFLENSPISFSFVKHLLDINLFSLSFSTEVENIGRFHSGIKYINYGTFEAADEFGKRTGEFSAGELAFLIGYSGEFQENFYYGANAKVIYSSIEDKSSSAIGLDLGLHYTFPAQQINIAAAVLNLGTQLSSFINTTEDLPIDLVVGVSKRLEKLPVRISLDFHRLNKKRDDFLQHFKGFTVGTEFYLSKVFSLRLGYDNERRAELKVGSTAGIAGFNAGLGILISDYQFNYGYSSLGLVGATHRVTVSTAL